MKKLTPAQKKAMAILPCYRLEWEKKVPEKVRQSLVDRGMVMITRRPGFYAQQQCCPHPDLAEEPTTIPELAYPRVCPLHPGYLAIREESQKVGWPTAHKGDLFIDRDSLALYRPKVFAWFLREYGTHLIMPDPDMTFGELNAYIKTCAEGGPRCYLWRPAKGLTEEPIHVLATILDTFSRKLCEERGNRLAISDEQILRFVNRTRVLDRSRPLVRSEDDTRAIVPVQGHVFRDTTVRVSRGREGRLVIDL